MKILFETVDTTGEFRKSPAYKDYESVEQEIRQEAQRIDAIGGEPDEKFFHNIELVLRYGPFKKLGQGSSRTAYAFDADPRYVLKFGYNVNGQRQNQTELRNANKGDYKCMVRVLAHDENGIVIVEDRCRESRFADWNRILGISPTMLSKLVRTVFERHKTDSGYSIRTLLEDIRDLGQATSVLRKTSDMDDDFQAKDHNKIVSCVENIIAAHDGKTTEAKWVAISDLFRFYMDHGLSAMIPEEISFIDQWGVKSGLTPDSDSLVIIDPGVDSDFMPNTDNFIMQHERRT